MTTGHRGAADATPTVGAGSLRTIRADLIRLVQDHELAADRFPARFAEACDDWLAELLDQATGGKTKGFALVAVGGYGRRQLCPGSDLDLLLVHRNRRHVRKVAEPIWYAIWDSGMRLDHSVRTRKETLAMARTDLKVVLGLLDGRVVAGDEGIGGDVFASVAETWKATWRGYLPQFEEAVLIRHKNAGELAFLLEPDLKLSLGGLRDLAALRSLARALPELAPLANAKAVTDAEDVIVSARVAVQCRTSSAGDRLLLQEQDQVAEVLRYRDADLLMAAIAEAGRTISSACAEGWHRVHAATAGRASNPAGEANLGSGIVLRNGEIGLAATADPGSDPALVIKVALAAAERDVLIERDCLDRLEAEAVAPPDPWPDDLRRAFVALLQTGDALVSAVEAIDQRHLFELVLPEWASVRNRPQRNAYHRFTVDRHLLEAVARAGEHLATVRRPDLLVLAALFHDIGKGTAGDHSEVGTEICYTVARRMGYEQDDIDTLARLVAYHLVLPEFATRRDLDDPSTATLVAKLVDNRETLELLAALTEADGQATGSSAWGQWKAELVSTLAERVGAVLDGTPLPPRPTIVPTPEQRALLAKGELAINVVGRHVTVVAPDQTGLLSAVTGALALNGINVRRATAGEGTPGMALDVFDVEQNRDRAPDWEQVRRDVATALADSGALAERLARLDHTYSRARRPVSAHPTQAHVKVDNETSGLATIIEVRALDRLGLLHHVADAFAAADLDVASALVDTLGHEVIDTFYVRNVDGTKVDDPDTVARVTTLIEGVIGAST